MADRVGVINRGELLLVEDKAVLMKKLAKRELDLSLVETMTVIPPELAELQLTLPEEGTRLRYTLDPQAERHGPRRRTDEGERRLERG